MCAQGYGPDERLIFAIQEILEKLDAVTGQLNAVTKEKARDVSILMADLESEKEARRGWQDKAATLRERLVAMVGYLCLSADL
jgi:hypothetical protein